MPDQEEHENPQNMVEKSQELEREAARSLADAADSHATLEGYYSMNEIKPPAGEIENEEQALQKREKEMS